MQSPSARRYAALGLDRSVRPSKIADHADDDSFARFALGNEPTLPWFTTMTTNETVGLPQYLIVNATMGVAIGMTFGVGMLATDTASLWSLVSASTQPATAAIILVTGSVLTFTPLVIATGLARGKG